MIPQFPNFKKLELVDIDTVYSFTKDHAPYSDFDFISMWSWDYKGHMRLSQLHGNLVVRFTDYLTGDPFYSFIGINKASETAKMLIELSAAEGLSRSLKLVPEIVARKLAPEAFVAEENPDHTDYVISVPKLCTFEGAELANKRRDLGQFMRRTPSFRFEILDIENSKTEREIKDVFSKWLDKKNILTAQEDEHEYQALSRCISSHLGSRLIATGVYIEERLSAFWIIGDTGSAYSVSHFEKAYAPAYEDGISPYLKCSSANVLCKRGINYINLEQDLGIAGLRRNKMSYFPQLFLKKYVVTETR